MANLEEKDLLQKLENQRPWNPSFYFDQRAIDQFIISQNERLRSLMQEQSRHQFWLLLKEIDTRGSNLVKQKDEEMQNARNKTMELQNELKKLEMDKHAWERVAHRNQKMVLRLNKKLQDLDRFNNNEVDDAESCCDEGGGMVCKACKSRSCCVLFVPCRHLCSCKDCEPLLESCPVCTTPKKGSIEALFS